MRTQTLLKPSGRRDPSEPRGDSSASDRVAGDFRFRDLLGAAAWRRLPAPVRERFSRRLAIGASVTYAGQIVQSSRTRVGHVFAQVCRLIGAPLPLHDDITVAAIVSVTDDRATGGQVWTRVYGQARGFPQVVQSRKRFAGRTGLEEYLGRGFGIALTVSADTQALHFHSDHYFVALGAARLRLPRWLGPGALTISHIERGGGWFAFVLKLRHPLFGELISQTGLFRERVARAGKESFDD